MAIAIQWENKALPTPDTSHSIEPHGPAEAVPGQHWRTGLVWLGCFTTAALLYSATANGGPQWQDSGHHLLRVIDGKLINPLGLALSHPLHYWLGRAAVLQSFLPAAYAVTLISALAGALAVANVGGMTMSLTRSTAAALLAAGSLCFAHTFWKYSTLIETYTVTCALLSAEIWCLSLFLRGKRPVWLIAAFCYNGLGLANHNFALLTLPVLGAMLIWALARRYVRFSHLLVAVLAWIVTSAPYTALIVAEGVSSGLWRTTMQSALFGRSFADEVLNAKLLARETLVSLGFLGVNFPNLLLFAAVIGAFRARTLTGIRGMRLVLLTALLIHALFALRYSVPDQYTFLLPTYLLLCLLGGLGYAALARSPGRMRRPLLLLAATLLILTPAAYALLPEALRRIETTRHIQRGKPYRDDYVHFLTPWGCADHSAKTMSQAAIRLAGDRGVIFAPDSSAYPAIVYAARVGRHTELVIESQLNGELIAAAIAQNRRIVLVPADLRRAPPDVAAGAWRREGDLYLLQPGASPPGNPGS